MRLMNGVTAGATFSPCSTWRYSPTRDWFAGERALFIMLNPSTASHLEDDPTVQKCQRLAMRWGYGGITVANIFALRSTDPKALKPHRDPVGPENDATIRSLAADPTTDLVVVAWGNHGVLRNRGLIVLERLVETGVTPMRLGPPTKTGHPWHPLYRPDDIELEPAV